MYIVSYNIFYEIIIISKIHISIIVVLGSYFNCSLGRFKMLKIQFNYIIRNIMIVRSINKLNSFICIFFFLIRPLSLPIRNINPIRLTET